jgi:hypothetical protein
MISSRRLPALALATTSLALAVPAFADTTDSIDLQAGAGYSSNPGLRLNGQSAAFGRISAFALHGWHSERGSTSVSAYIENTTYLKTYGSKQLFDLKAHTNQAVSQTVTVFADLGFTGDFAGQLSNRLTGPPPPPEPGNPFPPTTNNPDLFGLSGRQYRITGQGGASIRVSPKDTASLSAGAEHLWFTGRSSPPSYNVYYGSAAYDHELSERTSVGGALYLQRQDFAGSDYANVINPVLTLHTNLAQSITASASVGIMNIADHHAGETTHSTTASYAGSLCDTTEHSRFCGRIARNAQSALGAGVGNVSGEPAVSTVASVDYFRRLTADSSVQASISGVRYSSAATVDGNRFRTTYISAVGGYDRKVGKRLSAGVNVGLRKVYQAGPDPDADLNGSVYLRYHIGDLL